MLKKTSGILCISLLVGLGEKAHGQSIENNVNSTSQPTQEQNLDNNQDNAAIINQTGIYNIGSGSTYRIQGLGGRQAACPRPSFILGSAYNSNDGISFQDNSSYSLNAAIIFPLGGKLGKTCEIMANSIAKKTQYDLEIINARSCAELIHAGISLDPEKFPTLSEVCEGVSLAKNDKDITDKEITINLKKELKGRKLNAEHSIVKVLSQNDKDITDKEIAINLQKEPKGKNLNTDHSILKVLNSDDDLEIQDYLNSKKNVAHLIQNQ